MSIRLRDRVTVTSTEYGLVLLDEQAGEYWNLNSTGALVVDTVLDGGTPADAARALADEHAVALERARTDVDELLAQLREANLVAEDGGRT
jgi:hypothetical protein